MKAEETFGRKKQNEVQDVQQSQNEWTEVPKKKRGKGRPLGPGKAKTIKKNASKSKSSKKHQENRQTDNIFDILQEENKSI